MSSNSVQELMRKGIDAARQGDLATARAAFEEVVKLDDQNEKAWFWLASVLEDEGRKKLALSTVLMLNPNNAKARQVLDAIETLERDRKASSDVIPGISRRTLTLLVGVGGGIILIVLALFLVVTLSNARQQADASATQTQFVQNQLDAAASQTAAVVAFEQTQAALTPTVVDLQSIVRTLPPTFTPTAGPTATPQALSLPFPPGLTGVLSAWAGRDFEQDGLLPFGTISLLDGRFTPAGEREGRSVSISPNGQRLAYTRVSSAFATVIEAVNVNGTDPEALSDRWRGIETLFDPQEATFSDQGDAMTFVARPEDAQTSQVYVLSLLAPIPEPGQDAEINPLRRITNDGAAYSHPMFSPDGVRVLAVRDDVNDSDAGADIVLIDIATSIVTPVTNDFGAFIESAPYWAPDGRSVVYSAAPADQPQNGDIAIRFVNGGSPTLIARDPADDRNPVFSPDGRYIAFSSNRSGGQYDIFVYDQQSATLYQLTNTPGEDEFIGGWR